MQELIHYPLQIYRDIRVLFLTCATESSHHQRRSLVIAYMQTSPISYIGEVCTQY